VPGWVTILGRVYHLGTEQGTQASLSHLSAGRCGEYTAKAGGVDKHTTWCTSPSYLADYCVPVSTVPGRQHLRSASRRQLIVPRVRRSTFGARAFAIAGPTVWNSLPDSLRDPAVGPDQFRRDLKTHLFEWHCVSFSALAVFSCNALYKSTFYLLTFYLLARIRGLAMMAGVWLMASLTAISAEVQEAVMH